ncbi:MAG: pyrroloquinoline-quinone synthase [Pseudonocardiales bacterium]|jgi:pyrroloquinoline-quinone synthase|nr:pyrroloquinoline-quinone synthase [Pseudonocardiales bacterium]
MTLAERTQSAFVAELNQLIHDRRKMTSPLYQHILAGRASVGLLREFVVHRYPIKAMWTRNILGIASRVEDYQLRRELVENIYEEETGRLTGGGRHLDTFVDVGLAFGLTREQVTEAPERLPETQAVIDHNVRACNSPDVHFTVGVASVLLLMEGQPPIVDPAGRSMEQVMRETYGLPAKANTFFLHHASSAEEDHVSELEDDHAETARRLLAAYCESDAQQAAAYDGLSRAIELRHRHFDAILARDPGGEPFRFHG